MVRPSIHALSRPTGPCPFYTKAFRYPCCFCLSRLWRSPALQTLPHDLWSVKLRVPAFLCSAWITLFFPFRPQLRDPDPPVRLATLPYQDTGEVTHRHTNKKMHSRSVSPKRSYTKDTQEGICRDPFIPSRSLPMLLFNRGTPGFGGFTHKANTYTPIHTHARRGHAHAFSQDGRSLPQKWDYTVSSLRCPLTFLSSARPASVSGQKSRSSDVDHTRLRA